MGKRLGGTAEERMASRARIFGAYSAMYGIPGAIGAATAIPFNEYYRKAALNEGYKVGDNWIESIAREGAHSMLLGWATGRYWNVADRYGAPGSDFIQKAMQSDSTVWKIMGGAIGSTLMDGWAATDDLRQVGLDIIRGEGKFKLTADAMLDPIASTVSGVNNIRRAYEAWNTGRWMSSKGNWLLGDSDSAIGKWEALTSALHGLSPQAASDTYRKGQILKDIKNAKQDYENSAIQLFRRGRKEAEQGNPDQAVEYWKNARRYLEYGFNPEEIAQIVNRGLTDRPQDQAVDWSLFKTPKGTSEGIDQVKRLKQKLGQDK